jgi:hypothetical protein
MSCEHNVIVSGQICNIVIGQSESLKKMCTACTAKNVHIVTKSRQNRCISTDTKGSLQGGGHALKVIQHVEGNSPRKTEKQIVLEKISFVSSSSSLEKHRGNTIYPVWLT